MKRSAVRVLFVASLLFAACQGSESDIGMPIPPPSAPGDLCTIQLTNSDTVPNATNAFVAASADGFITDFAQVSGTVTGPNMRRLYDLGGLPLPGSAYDHVVPLVPQATNARSPFQMGIASQKSGYLVSAFDNSSALGENWLVRLDEAGNVTAASKQVRLPYGIAEGAAKADDGDWVVTHTVDAVAHQVVYSIGRVDRSGNLEATTQSEYSFTAGDVSCARSPVIAKNGDTVAVADSWASADQKSRQATLYLKRPGQKVQAIQLSEIRSNDVVTDPPALCTVGGDTHKVIRVISHADQFLVLWDMYVPKARIFQQNLTVVSAKDGTILKTFSTFDLFPERLSISDIASIPGGYAVSVANLLWNESTYERAAGIGILDENFHLTSTAKFNVGNRSISRFNLALAINPAANRFALAWSDTSWSGPNPDYTGRVAFFSCR